ncbi:MAG: hypothetical protein ACMZ64_00875 [Oleiphilus sp.]
MSTTTITIVIFAVIFLCIGAISISQAREKARIEKIRRSNACTERYQRMQQLLHELPSQYLNNELRMMIAQRSIETLTELIGITKDPRHESSLSADQDYLKQLREQNPKFPATPIKSETQAKNVRQNLEVLQRFIQTQHKNKRIPTPNAKKYLDFISFSICQSKADLFCSRAEAAKSKPRVAIHNYHSAIDAFKPIAKQAQAAKIIQQYKAKIKALDEEANQANKSQTATPIPESGKQAKEWDSFLDKEEPWQKKNNYDD